MKVGLALEIDESIDSMAVTVTELNDLLRNYFLEKNYGSDVENIFIGVILTNRDSESSHPVRKLKFTKRIKIGMGKPELRNVVAYDVKPSFEIFSQLSHIQARQYLAQLLSESISVMEKHRSKFANFAIEHFKEDFRNCLAG
jgi:hypothetical protein